LGTFYYRSAAMDGLDWFRLVSRTEKLTTTVNMIFYRKGSDVYTNRYERLQALQAC
jgi:hypothetical protein